MDGIGNEWDIARFALAGIVLMNHNQRVVDVSLSEKVSFFCIAFGFFAPRAGPHSLLCQARHWFYFSIVKSKSWKIGIKAFGIFMLFPGALVLASAQIELEVTLRRWKPKPEALWLCLRRCLKFLKRTLWLMSWPPVFCFDALACWYWEKTVIPFAFLLQLFDALSLPGLQQREKIVSLTNCCYPGPENHQRGIDMDAKLAAIDTISFLSG